MMIPVSSTGMRVPVRVPVDPLVEDPLVAGDHGAAGVERPGVRAARRVQVVPEHQRQGLLPDGQTQLGEHGPSAGDGGPQIDHRSCQPHRSRTHLRCWSLAGGLTSAAVP